MSDKPTRREFLGAAAATAALGLATPRLFAADAKSSPNDTINLGVIGCGDRAREVLPRFKALPGNRVVMVCDVHSQRMNEVRDAFGDGKATTAGDFRKVLDNKDVDAVFIATQAHWHVLPMILALKAGKDVYLEKPVGNFIGEQIVAREAAKKYDRIVQIGTQQRSREQYQQGGRDHPVGPAGSDLGSEGVGLHQLAPQSAARRPIAPRRRNWIGTCTLAPHLSTSTTRTITSTTATTGTIFRRRVTRWPGAYTTSTS